MAPPAGHIRPGRYLTAFAVIVVALYALIFLTGDHSATPKLGIDLRGGTTVTLTARTPNGQPPSEDQLNQAQQIIETRVNGLGVSGAEVVRNGTNIVITVPGDEGAEAKDLGQTAKLVFRPVIQSVPATTPPPAAKSPANTAPSTTTPGAGAAGSVAAQQAAQIAQAKATRQSTDPQTVQQALQTLDCSPGHRDPLIGNDDPALPLVACDQQNKAKYLLGPAFLDGTQVTNPSAQPDPNGVGYIVVLNFTGSGTKIWANYTSNNVGQQAAFVLDTEVVSAPSIETAITGGNTQIQGNFSQAEAQRLADILKYGSLPLAFDSSNAQTVSATLGLTSLRAGLVAGGIGLLLVVVYCLFYYRALGVLTVLSLALSGVTVYAVLVLLGRWVGYSLNLAGVAGFIIAIGITADSFVVFFERLKDEIREGRTFRSSVPRAWVRARRTILSADAVSFLAAVVLYVAAVGDVQGFAFTLGMSTALDLLIVFLVTHPLVVLASRSKLMSKPSMSGLGALRPADMGRRVAAPTVGVGTKEA